MMEVRYFAYGAMEHPAVIKALLGRLPERLYSSTHHVHLTGYKLVVQNLEHVPDTCIEYQKIIFQPRALLHEVWGDKFRSYGIVKDPEMHVFGTIWLITESERELMREYELIHWGWFVDIPQICVRAHNCVVCCCTEALGSEQQYSSIVDVPTATYKSSSNEPDQPLQPLLMPEAQVLESAHRVGDEFRNR